MRKRTSPIWLDSKENFIEIVRKSDTYVSIINKYNLGVSGNNYQTVKDRIDYEKIDIGHFDPNKAKVKNLHKKTPLEEILVEDSTFSRKELKKRLIEEGKIPYICEVCKNGGEWEGQGLVLQLEHKNGVSNDNRLHNLCFLCPNCHSQTSTFAGRKNKIIHKCLTCSNPIKGTGKTGECNTCLGDKRRKVKRPSKADIQKSVNSIGYSASGRLYNVSDNAVRKWLK